MSGDRHQNRQILTGGQFVVIQAVHELRIRVKRPHATLCALDQFCAAEKRLICQPHDLPFLHAAFRAREQMDCFRERCTVPNPELQKRAEPQKRICRYRCDIQTRKQIIKRLLLAATAPLRDQPAGDKPVNTVIQRPAGRKRQPARQLQIGFHDLAA